MVLNRNNENQPNLQINNFPFVKVENFKYLRMNVNNKNDMHREISEIEQQVETGGYHIIITY